MFGIRYMRYSLNDDFLIGHLQVLNVCKGWLRCMSCIATFYRDIAVVGWLYRTCSAISFSLSLKIKLSSVKGGCTTANFCSSFPHQASFPEVLDPFLFNFLFPLELRSVFCEQLQSRPRLKSVA